MSTAVHSLPTETPTPRPSVTSTEASILRLGAVVSVVQSALFVTIGISALVLGVDPLVDRGFAALTTAEPTAFRTLCGAFVLIAVLGLAITPAERALVEVSNPGLARFGSVLAYLGHAGTIAFFSWWLLKSIHNAPHVGLDSLAPIDWGVMFELVFLGGWVWVIAALLHGAHFSAPGFVALSVAKAMSFWFAFLAFVINAKWMILFGVGAVTFFTGPLWHLWIARIFLRHARRGTDVQ